MKSLSKKTGKGVGRSAAKTVGKGWDIINATTLTTSAANISEKAWPSLSGTEFASGTSVPNLVPYVKAKDADLDEEAWLTGSGGQRKTRRTQRTATRRTRLCDSYSCAFGCPAKGCSHGAGLGLLRRDDEQLLVSEVVAKEPTEQVQDYVVVKALVDSGAEDTVTPPGTLPGDVVPSPMSRSGRRYRAANGAPIENLGQTMSHFKDARGRDCGLPFQVAAVERPLVSVTQLADAGHEIRFTKQGGSIRHAASGRTIPLKREKGVYVLEMRVPAKRMTDIPDAAAAGFPRQDR